MDPIPLEDPDARPKRLVVLATSGMVIATGFATIAAMVLGSQRHTEATPDVVLDPTSSRAPSLTWTTPPPMLPPPLSSSEAVSSTSGSEDPTSLTTSSTSPDAPGVPSSPGDTVPPPPDRKSVV